jgi:hypothetical protein
MEAGYRATAGTISMGVALLVARGFAGDAGIVSTGIGVKILPHADPIPTTFDIAIQSLGGLNIFVGNVKIGANTTPAAALDVTGTGAVGRLEVTSASTNAGATALSLVHKTSAAMIDGFGVQQDYVLMDNSGFIENINARVIVGRSGADNTGTWRLQTAIAGVLGDRISLNAIGDTTLAGALILPIAATAQSIQDTNGDVFSPAHYTITNTVPRRWSMARGTTASPDTLIGPSAAIYRKVSMSNGPPSTLCGNGLEGTCATGLMIVMQGTSGNQVSPSGLVVIGSNDALVGDSGDASPLGGQADYAGVVSIANLSVLATSAGAGTTGGAIRKQSVGGYFEASRYVANNANIGFADVHALELQVGNFTATDCLMDTSNSQANDCGGIAILGKGGTAAKLGMGVIVGSAVAGQNLFQLGYACMGVNRGVSVACFDDVSTAVSALRTRGSYSGPILDLSVAAGAGVGIQLKGSGAAAKIFWLTSNMTIDGSLPEISPGIDDTGAIGGPTDRWNSVNATVYKSGANNGLTVVKSIRAAGGAADCTITITGGIITATTC